MKNLQQILFKISLFLSATQKINHSSWSTPSNILKQININIWTFLAFIISMIANQGSERALDRNGNLKNVQCNVEE